MGYLGPLLLGWVWGNLGTLVARWKKKFRRSPVDQVTNAKARENDQKQLSQDATEPRAKTADHDKNNERQLQITKKRAQDKARNTKGQFGISLYIKIFFNSR